MLDWNAVVSRTLLHEGGLVDNPADPGGLTNFGLSQRSYPDLNLRSITRDQAIEVYKRDYFSNPRFDQLPMPLAFQVFDAGVQHGVIRATQWLQYACGATQDGVLGNQTFAAIASQPLASVVMAFIARRMQAYVDDRNFSTFGKGWMDRMAENIQYAAQDLR